MAKTKLAKRNPPEPRKEPGVMKLYFDDHFPGRISETSKFKKVIAAIQCKLTRKQLSLFRSDVFGHFLDLGSYNFSGVIFHNLLLRQVAHKKTNKNQLWFQIGEHLVRLSIGEWCLITGLSNGPNIEPKNLKTQHRLLNKYFGGRFKDLTLKQLDARFSALKFRAMDDTDALKIALYYFADRVLKGRKDHSQADFQLMNHVDDIDHFRSRPWGRLSWEIIYDSLDNALNQKANKFKMERLKDPSHNIEKYNIYGFSHGVQAWLFEVIEGIPSQWAVKINNHIPRILKWKAFVSSKITYDAVHSFFNDNTRVGNVMQTLQADANEEITNYWKSVKDYVPRIPIWVRNHQFIGNAPLIRMKVPEQNPIDDEHAPANQDDRDEHAPSDRDEHAPSDHDDHNEHAPSDHNHRDEHAPADQDDRDYDSDNTKDRESRTKLSFDYVIRRMDKIDSSISALKSELREFRQDVMGFIHSYNDGTSKRGYDTSPTGRSYMTPGDRGVYTDVGGNNDPTPMSLYSLYGEVSGDSVQILTEAPPCISKFGRPYRPSYVFDSPYMIPPFKKVRNIRPAPTLQIMDRDIDERTNVDINPLRGLEDPRGFDEFDQWFAGAITVDRTIRQSHKFFEILLGHDALGWLGDEHIHQYLRLISEKQRQYPNAMSQRVTHTDTFFWVFLKQLWNDGDCDLNSLQYSYNFNSYIDGREEIMSKRFTDVDMVFIPVNLGGDHWIVGRVDLRKKNVWIYDSLVAVRDDKTYKDKFKPLEVVFPRWLEDVGFYNVRHDLRNANPWNVKICKGVPQQEPGSGDCGVFMLMITMYLMFGLRLNFTSGHGQYFRKKIAVDIFNGDIGL